MHYTNTSLFLFYLVIKTINAAEFQCEDLPIKQCAFAVSSYGKRCVLEKYVLAAGDIEYKCQTSNVMVERGEMIESEGCVNACGLQKMGVGMSTDALAERDTTRKICSSACRDYCPNIIDLYAKLAVGEGCDLYKLCESMDSRPRKMMRDSYYSLSVSAATENTPINTAVVHKNAVQFSTGEVISPGITYYADNYGSGYAVVKDELPLPAPNAMPLPMMLNSQEKTYEGYGQSPQASVNIH